MSSGMFLVVWLGSCGLFFCAIAAIMNYDVVVVFVLRAVNAPVYSEARMIAALLYQHPEQWKASTYSLEHPTLGTLRASTYVSSVELDGQFGHWQPTAIEKRIIWNAVSWYRRDYIKSLLRKAAGE